jgi:NAD+ kinase
MTEASVERSLLFIINTNRADAIAAAEALSQIFLASGFTLHANAEVDITGVSKISDEVLPGIELVIVLGGDGTMLRAAESVRGHSIPLLGVNLGRVGFLAEVDKPSLPELARAIQEKDYLLDPRMVLAYSVTRGDVEIDRGWALNEVTIERNETTMVELFVQIDHRPLSRWGCDGLICSTPTGSTAYAFSAGGPVVWPEVEALVMVPISAHALFSKAMVVSPTSKLVVDVESTSALLSSDSRRKFYLKEGDRITLTKDSDVVTLAHLREILFTDRLVAKFKLPIEGWRGE